jgi:glycosyltransferase involved in cell wall biosynthesis
VWFAYDNKRGAFNDYEEAAAAHVETRGLQLPISLTLSTKSSADEYLRDLLALHSLIHAGELDVLHLHMSHDHGLAALSGRAGGKVIRVRTFHADRSLRPRFGQAFLNRRAEGWIVRCTAHQQKLIDAFGIDPGRTTVIPGSVDARRFLPPASDARQAARQRFALPADEPVLGHVALMAGRGQEELLEALALVDDPPYLLFAGRGEHEDRVRQCVHRSPLAERVRLAGYLEGEELLAAYAAIDAAFVAQPGNDASARAALEALASGLPVLAVQTGALTELVTDELGYPIAERSIEAIATALRAWLSDRRAGRVRGKRGRAYVAAERSFTREAQSTLAFYERLRDS